MKLHYRLIVTALLLAVTMLLTSGAQAVIHEIQVGNFFFTPLNTVVTQGDTVRWILASGSHSTTSDGGSPKSWDSGVSSTAGVLFELEFTTSDPPGDYPYFCTVHPLSMKDTLRVVAAPAASEGGIAFAFVLDADQADACNGTASLAVGAGSAVLSADSSELHISVIHTVTDADNAHIHFGAPCASGSAVHPFDSFDSPIIDTVPMTSQLLTDLFNGDLYVNVHSPTFPGGEIRGQIANAVQCQGGDADNNGAISISDAVYIINFIFGGGPAPACP